MAQQQHRIMVFKDGGCYKVAPAHVPAAKLDDLIWVNATGEDVTLFFPDGKLVGASAEPHHKEVAQGSTWSSKVGPRATKGHNAYAVYCARGREFAEGASHPDIIVG